MELTQAVLYMLFATLVMVSAAPLQQPTEVFMYGESITGFNPTNDTRSYWCFRIPQLLALPSSRTVLAFAEGRADGCRPDVNVNRPIVVRVSKDGGKSWGPISIAGPAVKNAGTNYPGAYVRDEKTVVLRYGLSNGTVFETVSTDEGYSWSDPVEASQPGGGVKCGSAWPKMMPNGDVLMPCAGGTVRSTDGGRSWTVSSRKIQYGNGTNVTGLGEMMAVPDGRSATSLTMMIRAGSKSGWYNHAVATSDDEGDTWGAARLLPIVGTTCQGSIGRNASAPPGEVLLAATNGANRYRLGRGNMTVFSLDEAAPGAQPVPRLNVWPNAAGYSDFAQVGGPDGPVMLLFEGGGNVYDYGIKISPVV